MLIKHIYTLFVGIFVALFVAMGVSVFYPEPKAPEYPPSSSYPKEQSPAEEKEVRAYEQRSKAYTEDVRAYNGVVSILVIVSAVIILAISLIYTAKLGVLADGLLLGGIFTLLYGMIRGLETNNDKFQFLVVTIGLGVALALGYLKFIRADAPAAKPGKSTRKRR